MTVSFVGTPYDPQKLFVCGTYQGGLSCVDYVYFQQQLQETK